MIKKNESQITLVPIGQSGVSASQILDLAEAGLSADFNGVKQIAREIVDSLDRESAPGAERRLQEILRGRVKRPSSPAVLDVKTSSPLMELVPAPREPIFLEEHHADLLDQFLREVRAVDRLAAAGLATRANMLLLGPPGVGKTTAAGHIAARLGRPFYVVRLDSLISSMLGDTAKNVRLIFDNVRRPDGFVFIDEIDAIAKFRDDPRDVGELKRVVNTVIQALDSLPIGCVVLAATNHGHLLDPAIWRRFPYQLEFELPSAELRTEFWAYFLEVEKKKATALALISGGLSGSDIREISFAARRAALLDGVSVDIAVVAESVLRSRGGRLVLPRRRLTDKSALHSMLSTEPAINQSQVAILRGVTPQAERDYNNKRGRLAG